MSRNLSVPFRLPVRRFDHGSTGGVNVSIGPSSNMSTNHTPRKSKQQRLANAIVGGGILPGLRALHDRGRIPVLILAYHRIVNVDDPQTYPLDLGLISATRDEFDSQMRAVREFANPVSLDMIADAVTHGRTLPERAVAVTFDDGFRDTFEAAHPVLRQYAVPATVFVSTDLIESNDPFWFEITAHLMLRVPARAIAFDECPEGLPSADDPAARRESIGKLHRVLKICANPRRRALVEEWRVRFARFIDARADNLSRPIVKTQMIEMARDGIDFGSHTVTHPNLALESTDVIERELRDSRAYLEHLLERPVRSLAYPFGTPDTYDSRVMTAARACGYELAASFRQGVNWLGTLEAMELRRIGIGPGVSAQQFRAMLALPAWLHPKLRHDHT
jgi:peptidoglycan/xylan/chitin deacetylase (PgdA/CDA1 family)